MFLQECKVTLAHKHYYLELNVQQKSDMASRQMATSIDFPVDVATSEEDKQDYDILNDLDFWPELQHTINAEPCCKPALSLNVLVAGKTHSGKSSLVNGLLGIKLDKEKHQTTLQGIVVTVWDSPSLEAKINQDYFQHIKSECDEPDLIVYCINVTETRFVHGTDNPDVQIMRKLTEIFGKECWTNAIVVLTFADTLQAFEMNWESLSVRQKEEKFQTDILQWGETIRNILSQDISIRREIVDNVKIVPAAHYLKVHLTDQEYWLSNLWICCISTIKTPEVRLALLKININRLKREHQVHKDDFKQPPEAQPIVIRRNVKESKPGMTEYVAGVTGGVIGGAVFGMMGLIASPAALAISLPVSMGMGALIGAGAVRIRAQLQIEKPKQ